MNQQFETPEDIDRHYMPLIENEPDLAEKANLRVAQAEAKIRLKEQNTNEKVVAAWKKLALIEYPHAAKFPEMVSGTTEDEIRASAQSVHNRVSEMMTTVTGGPTGFDAVRQQAQEYYGPGPTTGGSGQSPVLSPPNMQEERWNMAFAQRFNDAPRDPYGQRIGITKADTDRYTNNRFIGHVKDRLNFWAQMTRSDAHYRTRT